MQATKQVMNQLIVNPYSMKHRALDVMTSRVQPTTASMADLEQMRLNASEVHTSVEGVEKFLCTCEWAGYN